MLDQLTLLLARPRRVRSSVCPAAAVIGAAALCSCGGAYGFVQRLPLMARTSAPARTRAFGECIAHVTIKPAQQLRPFSYLLSRLYEHYIGSYRGVKISLIYSYTTMFFNNRLAWNAIVWHTKKCDLDMILLLFLRFFLHPSPLLVCCPYSQRINPSLPPYNAGNFLWSIGSILLEAVHFYEVCLLLRTS